MTDKHTDASAPRSLLVATAAAVAVQLGAASWGIAAQDARGLLVAVLGAVPLGGAALLALRSSPRAAGSLVHRVVLGATRGASTAYALALAAATWSFLADAALLAGGCAVLGGVVYAVTGARRQAGSAPSVPSVPVLTALALLAVVGGAALVVGA